MTCADQHFASAWVCCICARGFQAFRHRIPKARYPLVAFLADWSAKCGIQTDREIMLFRLNASRVSTISSDWFAVRKDSGRERGEC